MEWSETQHNYVHIWVWLTKCLKMFMLPGNLECHIMVKPMQIQQIENSCLIQSWDHTSLSIWRRLKIKWSWRTGSIPGSGLGIHGNILSYSMLSKAEPSVQLWNASGGDLNHYARSTSLPWGISGHWIRFGGFYSIPRCSIPSQDVPFHPAMFHSITRCSMCSIFEFVVGYFPVTLH